MGISFKGVETAKANQGANYVRPGDYLARVDKVKEDESRKGDSFIAVEMTVFHVFEGEHKCAENVTHMLMQKFESFLGNWKRAIMGITGCAEDEVSVELSEKIISEEQPLSGCVVRLKAHNIKTREKQQDFTVVEYHGTLEEEEWQEIVTDDDRSRLSLQAV